MTARRLVLAAATLPLIALVAAAAAAIILDQILDASHPMDVTP